MNNIKENQERFESIVRGNIKRQGVEKLLEMLAKTDFYTAPASTKYHDSEAGGLCKHSLNVFDQLIIDLRDLNYTNPIAMETQTIVSLLHDVCKINFYTVSSRNVKDQNGKWDSVPYYTVDDKLPLGHGEKSVIMLMQLLELTTDEIMAIRWHMGAYSGEKDWNTLGQAYEQCPLALYLHIADMKATYLK